MEWMKKSKGLLSFLFFGTALLILLMVLPATASAAEDEYTLSLRPSADVVRPGDTIQLAVQVHNNGWPDNGGAEVAAFQAMLEYDHNVLEYRSVDIPEGTMGDFSPDSGIVLGYGEGHVFQENYDCAVLTMKVSESAGSDIPIALNQVILAKQDATELTVSAADPLILKVGGEGNAEESGGNTLSGSNVTAEENKGAEGENSGSGQSSVGQSNSNKSNSDQATASGQTDTPQEAQGGTKSSGSGKARKRTSGISSVASGEKGADDDAPVAGKSTDSNDEVSSPVSDSTGSKSEDSQKANPGILVTILLVVVVLAVLAWGVRQYQKRKRR